MGGRWWVLGRWVGGGGGAGGVVGWMRCVGVRGLGCAVGRVCVCGGWGVVVGGGGGSEFQMGRVLQGCVFKEVVFLDMWFVSHPSSSPLVRTDGSGREGGQRRECGGEGEEKRGKGRRERSRREGKRARESLHFMFWGI